MAEGDGAIYRRYKHSLASGSSDVGVSTVKVALVDAYTPNAVTDASWGDIWALEITGTGYTASGVALGSKTVTEQGTGGAARAEFDAANTTWTGFNMGGTSGSPSHAVMYDDTSGCNTLMAYWEINTVSNGGDYTLAWAASGIITLT